MESLMESENSTMSSHQAKAYNKSLNGQTSEEAGRARGMSNLVPQQSKQDADYPEQRSLLAQWGSRIKTGAENVGSKVKEYADDAVNNVKDHPKAYAAAAGIGAGLGAVGLARKLRNRKSA